MQMGSEVDETCKDPKIIVVTNAGPGGYQFSVK